MGKRLILLLLGSILMPPGGYTEQGSAQFEAAYQAAQQARQRASALGYEWTTTRKLLKAAKAAAASGDYATAIELAREAERHGELAVEQAQYEDQVWMNAVPRLPDKP